MYSEHLKPSDWEIVVRAPGNFFLAGEHAVMFGHPAVCQALPQYTYVGLRRRLKDRETNLDLNAVTFFDVMRPGKFRHDFEYPARFVACQLERLLESDGWRGVDIGIYSELPSMCGLASSGALASALSIGLNLMFERNASRSEILDTLKQLWAPNRRLSRAIQDPVFCSVLFPQAWRIDSLFHNHQSSGANAFFSLAGSPNGLPAWYRQIQPRKGDLDAKVEGFAVSRSYSRSHLCSKFGTNPKPNVACPPDNVWCPDFGHCYKIYSDLEIEARDLSEDFPSAGSDLLDFACALVFSGKTKTTERAIRLVKERIGIISEYFASVPFLGLAEDSGQDIIMAYLGSVAAELWKALGEYFSSPSETSTKRVLEKIEYAQAGLRNLIWVSTAEIDRICAQAHLGGFAGKLTGGGTGGDVLVMCGGADYSLLKRFLERLQEDENASFDVHFHGQWRARDLACHAEIVKAEAHRFLAAVDLKQSESLRQRAGNESFDWFDQTALSIAKELQGVVLAAHRTDDQRIAAFERLDEAKRFLSRMEENVRNSLSMECWTAIHETPYDWAAIQDLEPSAEQSRALSDLIHNLKRH